MGGVALVLGGGGLVGHAWHVGVLAGLSDATGWDPCQAELIVGTSAGAVVGAELRAGLHPVALMAPGVGAAPPTVPRPARGARSRRPAAPAMALRALVARAPAGLALAGLLPRGRHDPAIISDAIVRLPITAGLWPPGLWVSAVGLEDGQRVVFGRGSPAGEPVDLPTAVAASCAMAGFFRPVSIAGRDYVDGGSRSATNADLAGGGNFDLVMVSSPMSLDVSASGPPRRKMTALARRHRLVHHVRLEGELVAVRRDGTAAVAFEPGPEDIAVMGSIAASMDFGRRAAVAEKARERVAGELRSAPLATVRSRLEAAARSG
ncbi:MAG: patatin-like phospholipase family protein [Acidimicrobiales bacterium]